MVGWGKEKMGGALVKLAEPFAVVSLLNSWGSSINSVKLFCLSDLPKAELPY